MNTYQFGGNAAGKKGETVRVEIATYDDVVLQRVAVATAMAPETRSERFLWAFRQRLWRLLWLTWILRFACRWFSGHRPPAALVTAIRKVRADGSAENLTGAPVPVEVFDLRSRPVPTPLDASLAVGDRLVFEILLNRDGQVHVAAWGISMKDHLRRLAKTANFWS